MRGVSLTEGQGLKLVKFKALATYASGAY
jgi:hypothetical protein